MNFQHVKLSMENIRVMQMKLRIKLNKIQEIRKNPKDLKIEDDVLVAERSSNFDHNHIP
jgi:hypothetical protein